MTDTNQTPEPTPAETPTAPLPPTPEATATADTAPMASSVPPTYAQQPATAAPHHGAHVRHQVSDGAIAIMVIGVLLVAMLSFGVGWGARSAALRFQVQRAGMMGRGYGQGFGGAQGLRGYHHGRGGMMGGGYGYGGGQGQYGQGQTQVPLYGPDGGYAPPSGGAVPTTTTPQ